MQQGLPLGGPAIQVAFPAVLAKLGDVPFHGLPSLDLPFIVRTSSAYVVPAVPLKPPLGVFVIDPSLLNPVRQRLRSLDFEIIQPWIRPLRRQLCPREPLRGELLAAIRHVLSAKDTQFEHLLRRQFRLEIGMENAADRFR